MNENPFDAEIKKNISATIKRLRAGGTVSMSLDNLRQVTPTPKTLVGAPVGGNVPWQYAQRFAAVVEANPAFVQFVYAGGLTIREELDRNSNP